MVSQDHLNFTALPVPVLPRDNGSWHRPDPHDLFACPSLLDANTGTNQLGDHWLLAYMYVQPNEGMNKRYLVFRNVDRISFKRARQPSGWSPPRALV
jgi:hypothetical protein